MGFPVAFATLVQNGGQKKGLNGFHSKRTDRFFLDLVYQSANSLKVQITAMFLFRYGHRVHCFRI